MEPHREIQATTDMGATSLTKLAPLQSCARFCLDPAMFPQFMAFLRKEAGHLHAPEWFSEDEINADVAEAHDMVGTIEDQAHAGLS